MVRSRDQPTPAGAADPETIFFRKKEEKKLFPLLTNPAAPHLLKMAVDENYSMTGLVNQGERNNFVSTWEDNAILKQVLDTHIPDGTEVDSKPIISIVEDILLHATIDAAVNKDTYKASLVPHKVKGESHKSSTDMLLKQLSYIIQVLASVMYRNYLTYVDGHTSAFSLLQMVGNFHWDAKLTLILAAFALNYGSLWLHVHMSSENRAAKQMGILSSIPHMMEHSKVAKPKFDALNKDIHSILELNKCIIQYKELPSTCDRARSKVPIAAYWNVRGIVECVAQIASFTHTEWHETESKKLSFSVHKINDLLEFLKNQLEECHRIKGERKEMEFRNSFNQLYETVHIDNMKILKILLTRRDDPLPLFDGSTKKMVGLEVLRRSYVLLLISRLDMSPDELSLLKKIYYESRIQGSRMDALYNLVWVPIVDPYIDYTDAMHTQFEDMKNSMPWYSVSHPSNIDRVVKKAIRDRWHSRNKPIVVVLDPQGRELSPNALHMMWIWGSTAFPFTMAREEALWREETWRLELLVDGMDPTILNWVREEKYIFLYGGDDIEWIRKFTSDARAIANAAGIPLEMAYVGKSKKSKSVSKTIDTINEEKLSHCLQNTSLIRFFWTRLESMLFSKIQLKRGDDQDLIMQQIKKLLSYDRHGSWALLCKGSQILTNGHASTMLQTPVDFDVWKEHIPSKGFDLSFKDYHDKLHVVANNCCRIEFQIEVGRIPEDMWCPECHRLMEKYIAFLCCHDQTGLLEP
ncbi:putative sieve element occlusion [Helianthus debilis subsp. tardiflorus]